MSTTDYTYQQQDLHFLGVSVLHQILAQCMLPIIFDLSHGMLFYFAIQWPDPATIDFWSFALDQAVSLWNPCPHTMSKLNLIDLTKKPNYDELCPQCLHVFGFQVYNFKPNLLARKMLSKWYRGSGCDVLVGYIRDHKRIPWLSSKHCGVWLPCRRFNSCMWLQLSDWGHLSKRLSGRRG